jgi:hypothetical protein
VTTPAGTLRSAGPFVVQPQSGFSSCFARHDWSPRRITDEMPHASFVSITVWDDSKIAFAGELS